MKTLLGIQDERTKKGLKNILEMLFLKGGQILIGLLLVPMTLNYVDSDTYGIWLTISSMVAWISFFDIGINNGLKNKLTEALAHGDIAKAQAYVSTTYAILSLIFLPLMIVLLCIIPFIDWQSVLNVGNVTVETLVCSMIIVVAYFCINFIFSTINIVMLADQRPASESLRVFIQQLLTLAVIFIMTKFVPGSLVNLCLALCCCPLAIMILFNVTLFSGRYKEIRPKLSCVNFNLAPDLLKLGVLFFIIQIAGVIQYQLTNFLIIHNFGATEVTAYNIAYKYFNIAYMVWAILTTPIWAAVADAVANSDYEWIRSTVKKYGKVFYLFVAGMIVMFVLSQFAYRIWVGDAVSVDMSISFWVMIFNFAMMFSNIYVSVLNGASILKVQSILCLVSPIIFIFTCWFLLHSGLGVEAIILASIVANINGLIVAPIQYRHFIRKHIIPKGVE